MYAWKQLQIQCNHGNNYRLNVTMGTALNATAETTPD